MRRLGRTVISDRTAKRWQYLARSEGSEDTSLAGNCQQPVLTYVTGVEDVVSAGLDALRTGTSSAVRNIVSRGPVYIKDRPQGRVRHVDLWVRCRRCPPCLALKGKQWRARAREEIARDNRTWFSTYTMDPARHTLAMYEAIRREESRGNRWADLTSEERWRATCGFIRREWQLYMKRLRKGGASLRYLMVIERHTGGGVNDGLPHLHALIHERGSPVGERALRKQWQAGFSKHNLVDNEQRQVAYCVKYLTKDPCNRPYASIRYGRTD